MNTGGGGSQPNTVVTTQNKDPWSGAQPHLLGIMGAAQNLYANGTGYQPYTGQTVASITPDQGNAIGGIRSMAYQSPNGTTGVNAARGLAENMIQNQGVSEGVQNGIAGLRNTGVRYDTNYNDLSDPLRRAQSVYDQNSGLTNPYLQGLMDMQGRKIGDQVNSTMSGAGRYGSGAHTNVLSRNLAEAQLPLLAQDFQNRQQNMLGAVGQIQNAFGLRNQAAAGYGQAQQAIADQFTQGLNRAGQYSQLVPSLDEARYADLNRIMQTGDWERGINQQNLNAAQSLYQAQQAYPWEQLGRYNAIAGGAGTLGGTQTSTQPVQQPSSLQRGLGGALAGAGLGGSIFGPVGAGVGALGGGLLGFL